MNGGKIVMGLSASHRGRELAYRGGGCLFILELVSFHQMIQAVVRRKLRGQRYPPQP